MISELDSVSVGVTECMTTRERVAARLGKRLAKKPPAKLQAEALFRNLKVLEEQYFKQLVRGPRREMEKMTPKAYKRTVLRRLVAMSSIVACGAIHNASPELLKELQTGLAKNKARLATKRKDTDKPMRNGVSVDPAWAARVFPKRKNLSARAMKYVVQAAVAHGMSIGLRKQMGAPKLTSLVRTSVMEQQPLGL